MRLKLVLYMSDIKSFEEIIRIAISEEQKAVEFYLDMAKQVVEFESKTVLGQLARDEMRHKVILSTILKIEITKLNISRLNR